MNIKNLYLFSPNEGTRANSLFYENGLVFATDGECSAILKQSYDKSLEGKSVNKYGRETDRLNVSEILKISRGFDPDEDERWFFQISSIKGMMNVLKNPKYANRRKCLKLNKDLILFTDVERFFYFMTETDINIVYNNETHLYCVDEDFVGFMKYPEIHNEQEDDIIYRLTRLKYFPKYDPLDLELD